MGEVVPIRRVYEARSFRVETEYGPFLISGTLCGHVDVAVPQGRTLALSPDEVQALTLALESSREDVLASSSPSDDPRLFD
jgi:hypothetical protein